MTEPRIILWDWDNTLVDTFDAVWSAQNEMRVHYGLGTWTQEEAKKAMNQSGRNLIKDLVGAERAKEAREYFLERYAQNVRYLKLKENAKDVLDYTSKAGYINILASNKAKSVLLGEVKQLGVLEFFDKIIGAEEAAEDKPSKIFTDKAIEDFDSSGWIISIGDGLSDVKMAHNYMNGISILVFTDAQSAEFETEKPDYCVPNLKACEKILDTLPSLTK